MWPHPVSGSLLSLDYRQYPEREVGREGGRGEGGREGGGREGGREGGGREGGRKEQRVSPVRTAVEGTTTHIL